MTAVLERPVEHVRHRPLAAVPSTPTARPHRTSRSRSSAAASTPCATRCSPPAARPTPPTSAPSSRPTARSRSPAAGCCSPAILPPAWIAGTACLSVAKILENMELGHNILHGQWDWMRDPEIHSSTWEWDTMSPSESWKRTHNYEHHTFTNVVGKDRDVGYGILRMSEEQRWTPYYLGNPVYNVLLSLFFQWGVALHDVEVDRVLSGEKTKAEAWHTLKGIGRKVRKQFTKDYLVFPALAGPFFAPVLLGNLTANLVRNVWSHAIIFCGHFPDGAVQFEEEQLDGETRGQWYVRQMMGSANLDGGPLFHLMSGNLSFQIEHHLFPDLPSNRYAALAPKVRALAEEYGIEYTSGPLGRQYLQVLKRINRLALP